MDNLQDLFGEFLKFNEEFFLEATLLLFAEETSDESDNESIVIELALSFPFLFFLLENGCFIEFNAFFI